MPPHSDPADAFRREQPKLHTGRLLLRPFRLDDAAGVQQNCAPPEVAAFTSTVPHPYENGMAEAWIDTHEPGWAAGRNAVFAVTDASDGSLLGACGLGITAAHARGELGYLIGPPFWSRGFATEAARAVVAFGFDTLGLNRITSGHYAGNPASGRVLQKLGFVQEGVRRQEMRKGDVFHDLVVVGLLREEWAVRD